MPVEGRGLSSEPTLKAGKDRRLGNLATPTSVQKLRTALHAKAKEKPGFRFYASSRKRCRLANWTLRLSSTSPTRISLKELLRCDSAVAAYGPQGLARVLSGPNVLHHRQGQGKPGYFWDHAYLKEKSRPNCGGLINPNSGLSLIDSKQLKLTQLDFVD